MARFLRDSCCRPFGVVCDVAGDGSLCHLVQCVVHPRLFVNGMTAVTCAFIHYVRHAADREQIVLADNWLLVELVRGEKSQQFRLMRCRTKIQPAVRNQLIGLEFSGIRVETGRFQTEHKRRQFIHELRRELGEETEGLPGN